MWLAGTYRKYSIWTRWRSSESFGIIATQEHLAKYGHLFFTWKKHSQSFLSNIIEIWCLTTQWLLDVETLKKHSLSFLSNIIEMWYLTTQGFLGICGIIKVFRLWNLWATDMCSWLTLLIPCRCFGNIDMGKLCSNKAMKLDPHTIAGYVLDVKHVCWKSHIGGYISPNHLLFW